MKTAIELIAEERARQISVEGWTPEHDDKHNNGQLALAGAAYALQASGHDTLYAAIGRSPCEGSNAGWVGAARLFWPWDQEHWKPDYENPMRSLVKAGALIAAEIDRIQRAANIHGQPRPPEQL